MPDFENTSYKQREERISDLVGKQLHGDTSLKTDAELQGLIADKRRELFDLNPSGAEKQKWDRIKKNLHRCPRN